MSRQFKTGSLVRGTVGTRKGQLALVMDKIDQLGSKYQCLMWLDTNDIEWVWWFDLDDLEMIQEPSALGVK